MWLPFCLTTTKPCFSRILQTSRDDNEGSLGVRQFQFLNFHASV